MRNPQKQVDGKTLITEVIGAALGAQSFTGAVRALGQDEKQSLARAIRMDVDEWRSEFAAKLRETGSALLADLHARKDELKAGELAYSLAVCVDKAAALEGRSQLNASSVNIQVNNFGPTSKDALLSQLFGTQQQGLQLIEPTQAANPA